MKSTLLIVLSLLTASLAAGQTATFTFGEIQGQFGPAQNRCTPMTSWNGIAATDPNNPYAQNMGQICLNIYPNPYTSISIPWQLGFPNNGYLTNCSPTVWTPANQATPIDNGDGTGTNSFTASSCYAGQNTTITATVNYEKVIISSCGRYRCFHYVEWQVVGGSGTVTNQ